METLLHSPNIEDFDEESYGSLPKRRRFTTSPLKQDLFCSDPALEISPSQWNPLDEPSPLGLKLRKSPSLLELIQMRLSNGSSSSCSVTTSNGSESLGKRNVKGIQPSIASEKMKASNFNATSLRIGSWEYVSKYEGDLLVKCYFAKHKLVWEILDGILKSKIEIQWSDIVALKSNCPEGRNGSITVVLSRKPAFYRETNPQPRKHTLWHACNDFTNGQASLIREHHIQCPPGVLNKHFEKLVRCDDRLYALSLQPKIVVGSPYFETQTSAFENSEESKSSESNMLPVAVEGSPVSVMQDAHFISLDCGQNPSFKQKISTNIPSCKPSECEVILETIAQHVFSETHCATGLDEKSIMKKVDSFDCLLQNTTKDCSSQPERQNYYNHGEKSTYSNDFMLQKTNIICGPEGKIIKDFPSGIPREDSLLGDLFSSLPHVVSLPKLPKLLWNIVEDHESEAI